MRILLAALFVMVGICVAGGLLVELGVIDRAPWVAIIVPVVLFPALCSAALFLFNPWWSNPFKRMTLEEVLRRLEEEGLLETADFQARRAFGVAEYNDEGLHYFLELDDGNVLYLSGQYLYDFEPIYDDPDLNRPRSFPCTDFTIHRHRTEGFVVDIECRGTVLEPERIAPPLAWQRWLAVDAPEDGHLYTDRSYDELKEILLENAARG